MLPTVAVVQPNTIIDAPGGQSVKFGSQRADFSDAGTSLLLEEFDYKKPTRTLTQYEALGRPYKQVIISDFGTGTAVVQFKASSGLKILPTERFRVLDTDGATWRYFLVTEVGTHYSNGSVTKLPIAFRERINGF